jgi:hypothetical protein
LNFPYLVNRKCKKVLTLDLLFGREHIGEKREEKRREWVLYPFVSLCRESRGKQIVIFILLPEFLFNLTDFRENFGEPKLFSSIIYFIFLPHFRNQAVEKKRNDPLVMNKK